MTNFKIHLVYPAWIFAFSLLTACKPANNPEQGEVFDYSSTKNKAPDSKQKNCVYDKDGWYFELKDAFLKPKVKFVAKHNGLGGDVELTRWISLSSNGKFLGGALDNLGLGNWEAEVKNIGKVSVFFWVSEKTQKMLIEVANDQGKKILNDSAECLPEKIGRP